MAQAVQRVIITSETTGQWKAGGIAWQAVAADLVELCYLVVENRVFCANGGD